MSRPDILSTRRLDPPGASDDDPRAAMQRQAFDIDIDRIVFCDAFRRLQDKTQVHGAIGNDYVRSRLTHSMEVSRVGRQLGAMLGQVVLERMPRLASGHAPAEFGQAVAAACLIHDIGNPPFGHPGEDSISAWFTTTSLGLEILADVDPVMADELSRFDGNAQGLRVVTRLQGWRPGSGLNLTSAVLAAQCKYPFEAGSARAQVCGGKYNHFATERAIIDAVMAETGTSPHPDGGWRRHPLAYLVEAADDACYRVVDIEDAYVLKLLSFTEVEELLMSVAGDAGPDYRLADTEIKKIVKLRARAISRLVSDLANSLNDHLDAVVAGQHAGNLLLSGALSPALTRIEEISRSRIYANPKRVESDIVAQTTISTLLDSYMGAFHEREIRGEMTGDARRILATFPHAIEIPRDKSSYVRAVLDYVSGMTDRFAIDTARTLSGADPSGRDFPESGGTE